MTQLLSDAGPEIEHRIRSASGLWIGLDFDGTLTDHVPDPMKAKLLPGARELVRQLSARPDCRVAIITGRAISDVRLRIALPDLAFAGNHGLEIEWGDIRLVDPFAELSRETFLVIEQRLRYCALPVAAQVHNKGLTIAVDHYAASDDDVESIHRSIRSILAGTNSMMVQYGRYGCDIRPLTNAHKGTSAMWLYQQQATPEDLPIVVGDDLTDEDLFRSFPDAISICVGEQVTTARYRVTSSREVLAFLDRILALRSSDFAEFTKND
jgi:trehalose 6-phosphate phosphatase